MDDLRKTANAIANGDWYRATTDHSLGKLDFVALEERIYEALRLASAYPRQASMYQENDSDVQRRIWSQLAG